MRARDLVPLGLILTGLAGGCRQAPSGCAGARPAAQRSDRGGVGQEQQQLVAPVGPPISSEELATLGGRLFYLDESSGRAQVGRWRPKSGPAPVTSGAHAHFPAAAAPGGRLAVIEVEEEGEGAVHVERLVLLGPDGAQQALPTESVRARHPTFSPDGKWLIFESGVEGSSEIFRLAIDGTDRRRLTQNEQGNFDPQLAPDGASVAFASSRDGQLELYRMKPDGSEQTRLTDALGDDFLPRWSPTGALVAFISAREGQDRIYLTSPDGKQQRRACAVATPSGATQEGGEAAEKDHAWSPDGRRLVFAAREWGKRFRLWVAEVETGTCRPLTAGDANDDMPVFSPDGKYVAFVSERDGTPQVYLVRASGSAPVRLTSGAGPNWLPTWLP